jgi:predicted enzyme involved in methoxymalonyl-ACP biosynthesis
LETELEQLQEREKQRIRDIKKIESQLQQMQEEYNSPLQIEDRSQLEQEAVRRLSQAETAELDKRLTQLQRALQTRRNRCTQVMEELDVQANELAYSRNPFQHARDQAERK